MWLRGQLVDVTAPDVLGFEDIYNDEMHIASEMQYLGK